MIIDNDELGKIFSASDSRNLPYSPPIYPPMDSWSDIVPDKEIKTRWRNTLRLANDNEAVIYIHIPFCATVCSFCGLYSVKLDKTSVLDRYLAALIKEMRLMAPVFAGKEIRSIRFGGGTPSLLSAPHFAELAAALRKNFTLAAKLDFAVETAADQLTEAKLKAYKASGVNWLEIGVQSLDEKVLRLCNRRQSVPKVLRNITLAGAHIKGTAVDLMYGLVGQSGKSFLRDIETIAKLRPTRVSLYQFTENAINRNAYKFLASRSYGGDGDKVIKTGLRHLRRYGYKVEERCGKYWGWYRDASGCDNSWPFTYGKSSCAPYSVLGLGPSAISHAYQNLHYRNEPDFAKYCAKTENNKLPAGPAARLTKRSEKINYTLLKLVESEKIDERAMREIWGDDKNIRNWLRKLAAQGIFRNAAGSYTPAVSKLEILKAGRKLLFEKKVIADLLRNQG